MARHIATQRGINIDKLTHEQKGYVMLELLSTLEYLESINFTKGGSCKITAKGRKALPKLRKQYPELARKFGQ